MLAGITADHAGGQGDKIEGEDCEKHAEEKAAGVKR
jgi:hypothetical protein